MSALLIKQMLEDAEHQGATLTFDTSTVEDQGEDQGSQGRRGRKVVGVRNWYSTSVACTHDDDGRGEDKNTKMQGALYPAGKASP